MRTLCALESICLSGFFPNPKPRRLTPMIFQVNQNSWLSTSKSLRPSLPAPPPAPFSMALLAPPSHAQCNAHSVERGGGSDLEETYGLFAVPLPAL